MAILVTNRKIHDDSVPIRFLFDFIISAYVLLESLPQIFGAAGTLLIGDLIGVQRDAELYPDGVNGPAMFATSPKNMGQHGEGNVAHDYILQMAYAALRSEGKPIPKESLCDKLKEMMANSAKCKNKLYDDTKSTWKKKCRGWRG